MKTRISSFVLVLFFAGVGAFSLVTLSFYPGNGGVYVLFSILLNVFLFFGLRPNSIFFDTFLGVFFWLGFWAKLSFNTVFSDGRFHESVGRFDYTGSAYDRALLVVSVGVAGLLAARLIRERFLYVSLSEFKAADFAGLRTVYGRYRHVLWAAFFLLILWIGVTNAYFGIYQRGSVPRTLLPFGLGGVYTWLLLFGASSISAVFLNFELQLRKTVSLWLVLLVLGETFLSNVSMLSRGMVLNAGALMLGTWLCARAYDIRLRARTVLFSGIAFVAFFVASIFVVDQLRMGFYEEQPIASETLEKFEVGANRARGIALDSLILFIDRWVGMEGAMAVSSYPDVGWELWRKAWDEPYSNRGTSLYDREIAQSGYSRMDLSNRHFVTIPGMLAFFYYPGSFAFLLVAMFGLGILGAAIEIGVYKWGGGNLILCSLLSFVVAYRVMHFGYAPGRSYLLFGALVLNVALIYLLSRALRGKRAVETQTSAIP